MKEQTHEKVSLVCPNHCYCQDFEMTLDASGQVTVQGDRVFSEADAAKWQSVVKICSGLNHVVGLKKDGTVVSFGDNRFSQCDVEQWEDIVLLQAYGDFSVGMNANGKMMIAGSTGHTDNRALLERALQTSVPVEHPSDKVSSVQDDVNEDDFEYEVKGDTAVLTRYKGTDSTVLIPAMIGGKILTEIGLKAFENCGSLLHVVIPEAVRIIASFAFKGCINLISALVSDSVKEIGSGAFWNCKNLTMFCNQDSYAEEYSRKNKLRHKNDVIGQMVNIANDPHYTRLPDYLTTADDLTDDAVTAMAGKLNESILSDAEKHQLKTIKIEMQQVRLFCPAEKSAQPHNLVYVIERVSVLTSSDKTKDDFGYYTYGVFTDLCFDRAGMVHPDTDKMQMCPHTSEKNGKSFSGYAELKELNLAVVKAAHQTLGDDALERANPKGGEKAAAGADVQKLTQEFRTRLSEIRKKGKTLRQELMDQGMSEAVVVDRIVSAQMRLWEAELLRNLNGEAYKLPEMNAKVYQQIYTMCAKKPSFKKPVKLRSLPETKCGFEKDKIEGVSMMLYGSPVKTNSRLIRMQGESIYSMEGTCGLCQCANLLTLAGDPAACEETAISAAINGSPDVVDCLELFDPYAYNRGGTTSEGRRQILQSMGLETYLLPMRYNKWETLNELRKLIIKGHGVIVSVDVARLWQNGQHGGHAISLISVTEDGQTFVYNDTGMGVMKAISAKRLVSAMMGRPCNITTHIIR